jgi:predicted ATPase/class 3 adenylate cyclase
MFPTGTAADMDGSRKTLPTGTITFLFTDVVGNVPIWERDPVAMKAALGRHHDILYAAAQHHHGHVFKIIGDAFQIAFEVPENALEAALEAQRGLRDEPWGSTGPLMVRMGLHTGPAEIIEGVLNTRDYAVSHTLNRVARIQSATHGGQVLLSAATAELLHGYRPHEIYLRELGECYLKGMSIPERIYQVVVADLPDAFPPLISVSHPLHNLPLQMTSFIGREKEIAEVKGLLGRTRLLTLSGVGGTGKTRLALAAAAQLLGDFEHGVWLAALAPLNDPALIPSSVATLFGLRPETGRSLEDVLSDYLRSKRLLLILDNCEHLIQEAAQFANTVLQEAPEVKILATSRELLGLAGETVYLVPSMETPEPKQLPPIQTLQQFEAVRLFTERASAVLPAFTVTETNSQAVAQICWRLDGIPLAIELAAARVKVLSTELIAAHLDDRFRLLTGGSRTAFPRHQTLHALIDWSYGLLSEAEQVLFRRLSVFIGGWTLEAAEVVCPCTDQMEFEVLDGLAGLVNKSLIIGEVIGGEVHRYRLLETIRQYALEKLLEAGEAAQMRNLHLEYFVTFAEAREKKLHTPAFLEALEQLDTEIDNFRAALDWALGGSSAAGQHVKAAEGLRLATAMADYWVNRGLAQEGYGWLNTGLAMPGLEEHLLLVRARAYQKAAGLRGVSDTICVQLISQSVALYRKTDDRPGLARALINYGSLLCDTRPNNPHPLDYTTGMALIEEGIAIFEEIGDPLGLGWVFYGKSCIASNQKDYAAQRKMLEKGITALEQAGDILLSETAKGILAFSLPLLGDFETARRLGEQHLEFTRKVNDKAESIFALGVLGEIACFQEDFTRAESCCQEALALYDEIGILSTAVVWNSRMLGYFAARQGQNERARQFLLKSQSLGRKLPNGDGFGDPSGDLAFVLWMGTIAKSQGQPVLAARFLGAVEGVLETFFKDLDDLDQTEYERITSKVRAALDEPTFTAAWTEGRKLTLEQALEEALAFCHEGETVS